MIRIMDKRYPRNPPGTVAVLTCSAVDVLSHVAVRARTMGVFLATCFERDTFEALKNITHKYTTTYINDNIYVYVCTTII